MKNNFTTYLTGILTLFAVATLQGAPQHSGPKSGRSSAEDSGIVTDSVLWMQRPLRIYQTLDLPYVRSLEKRLSTGSATTYYECDLEKYPSTDLRNSFTGIVDGLTVTERSGMPGLHYAEEGLRGAISGRGFTPEFIVDGMPVYLSQLQLDPEEIESLTFVRDIADKALFGSRSAGGVIHITTRRGLSEGRRMRVGFESGVSVVDRSPEWVNGVEYARLQNQARINSGYKPTYSNSAIEGYMLQDPNNLMTPNVDYRKLMFKDTKPYYKANVSFDGGSERLSYCAYLGYAGEGDIFKVGSRADFNRLTVRTRLNAAITHDLEIDFGFAGGLSFRRSPRYGNSGSASVCEFDKAFANAVRTPAIEFPLIVSRDETTGNTVYGVSQNYGTNPYASLTENGFFTEKGRSGTVTASLTYDLHALLKGLKFRSYVGLDVFNMTRIGKNPDYTAVIYDPASGTTTKTSHEGTQVSGKSIMGKWTHQGLFLHEKLSYDYHEGDHRVGAAAVFYLESVERSGNTYRERQQSLVGSFDYAFREKYLFQAVVNYAGSSMFRPGKRYGVFPSFGIGWVLSEEGFLCDSRWLDFLKVRAQVGVLGYDSFGTQGLYEDYYTKSKGINFGPYTTNYQWLGSTNRYQSYVNTISRLGNPDLSWEKRRELTVGFDALLLRQRLSLELNYFSIKRDGIITNMSSVLPDIWGMDGVGTYENYNDIRYRGWEAALYWSDRIGQVSYTVGGSISTVRGKYLKYNEKVVYDYQRVTGSEVGSYRGYVCLGKFASQEEIDASPRQLFDDAVQVGDLKYADLNGDGIVDSNDTRVIGNTNPKVNYSVSLRLRYRHFDLTIVGTGRAGFNTPLTNDWYWNGWGTDNYSAFVRDNIGGDYPRLSYVKSNNNFQKSTFWLRDGGYFKIQNIELGYDCRFRRASAFKNLRVFLRGANLWTLSGIKDVDPENIDAGVTEYPLYRTFTAGFKLTF